MYAETSRSRLYILQSLALNIFAQSHNIVVQGVYELLLLTTITSTVTNLQQNYIFMDNINILSIKVFIWFFFIITTVYVKLIKIRHSCQIGSSDKSRRLLKKILLCTCVLRKE